MRSKTTSIELNSIIPDARKDLRSIHRYFSKILDQINFPAYIIPDVTSKYLVGLDMLKKKMYRESLFSHIKIQENMLYNARNMQYDELIETVTRELSAKDIFYAYEPNINLSISVEKNQFYLVWNYNKHNVKYSEFNTIRMGLMRERVFELKYFDNYKKGTSPLFGIYLRAPIFKLRPILRLFYFHIIEFNYILTSKSLPNAMNSDSRIVDLYFNPINFNEMNNYPPRILNKKSVLNAIQEIMYVVEQNAPDISVANIVVVSDTKYHRPFKGIYATSLDFNMGNYILLSFDNERYEWSLKISFPNDSVNLFIPFETFKQNLKKWWSVI